MKIAIACYSPMENMTTFWIINQHWVLFLSMCNLDITFAIQGLFIKIWMQFNFLVLGLLVWAQRMGLKILNINYIYLQTISNN